MTQYNKKMVILVKETSLAAINLIAKELDPDTGGENTFNTDKVIYNGLQWCYASTACTESFFNTIKDYYNYKKPGKFADVLTDDTILNEVVIFFDWNLIDLINANIIAQVEV